MKFGTVLRSATALALIYGFSTFAAADDDRRWTYPGPPEGDTEPYVPLAQTPGQIANTDITFKYYGTLPSSFTPRITTRDNISPTLPEPAGSIDADDTYPGVVTVEFFDPNSGDDFICSGTLINSRTVLTAGHCVAGLDPGFANDSDFQSHVYFGPDTLQDFLSFNSLPGTSQFAHPGFDPDNFYLGDDLALVSLSAPVYDVPYVQLAASAPNVGDVITLVGYGQAGIGSNPGTVFDLKRRVATNMVEFVGTVDDIFGIPLGGTSNSIWADFEDPNDLFNTDLFGTEIVTAREGSSDHGDSGGPIFNGLGQQVGITSGGFSFGPNPGGYGDLAFWTSVADFNGWIAANNPLRFALDNIGSGSWTDPGHWLFGVVPDNDTHFDDDPSLIANYNIARHYYEVEVSGGGVTTLSGATVEVDKLDVALPGTELNITNTATLNVWSDVGVFFNATLRVNGDLGVLLNDDYDVFLSTGGRLMGSGNVFADVVNSGGHVAPGNSIGTLTIDGDYIQTAASFFDVEASNSAADRLSVSGAAALAGTINITDFGTAPTNGQFYDIITTNDGVFGTFGTVNDLSAGPAAHLIYGSDFVRLLFGTPSFNLLADGPVETPVGDALEENFANGDMQAEILDLLALDPSDLHLALQSLNPTRIHAQGTMGQTMADLLRNQLGHRSHDLLGSYTTPGAQVGTAMFGAPGAQLASAEPSASMLASAAAAAAAAEDGPSALPLPNGYALFAAGDVAMVETDQAAAIGTDAATVAALTGGLDYSDGEGFAGGLALSYLDGKVNQDYGLGGSTDGAGGAVSAFANIRRSRMYIDLYASVGMLSFDSKRTILVGLGPTLLDVSGATDATQTRAGATVGLELLHKGRMTFAGVGGLYYQSLDIDGYTETGGGVFSAVIPDRTVDSFKASVGGEASFHLAPNDTVLPFIRVLLNHEFMEDAFLTSAAFAGGPTVPFNVPGPELGETWVSVGLGLSGNLNDWTNVYVRYQGDFGRDGQNQNSISAAARFGF